ncbi:PH domain-containing protein [Candidatus Gottesmanbacteria bacterium]|nr:PH domain-containing protein [Candidatus Gottesmanbacteria bacterium]
MPDIFVSPASPQNPKPSATAPMKPIMEGMKQVLSSYMVRPTGITFETQSDDETIILFLRKHWVTNLHWIVISFILLILPPILFPALFFSGSIPTGTTGQFLFFLILSWYLLTFSYMLGNFLIWYFTVSIVTEERVVDIDFVNLLNKRFSETRIAKIEDVTMSTQGFIRSFFDYGDVYVQTAGTELEFEFLAVPHPDRVVRIINQLMGKEEEENEPH